MTVTAKEKSKPIIYPCLSQALSLFVAAAYLPDPSSPGALASWKPIGIEESKTCKAFKDYDWWLWQIEPWAILLNHHYRSSM